MSDFPDDSPDDLDRDLAEMFAFAPRMDLPAFCYSAETGRPFERCLDCDRPLLGGAEPGSPEAAVNPPVSYQIHKVIVRREPVFEFALCFRCCEQLRDRMSRETLGNLTAFLGACRDGTGLEFPSATNEQVAGEEFGCHACGRARSHCHRYSLVALGLGKSLLLRPGPVILCDQCEGEIGNLISEETQREWDRFVEEHFDSPPGVEADPDLMPLFV